MKVSLKWLREYVDVPNDLKAFCDRLDLTGTGVEGVETVGDAFANIVTAQVVSKQPHPDSDHMWVCKVDVGENNLGENGSPEPLQIVCGAQNFQAGDHIVTALVGAELPGGVKIKKSKLRGVVSMGMNCSARELGLGSDHDGIMILPPDAPIGIPFAEYLNRKDTVLDLEITPNRPDCLSVAGMAREVGAMYGIDWKNPLSADAAKLSLQASSKFKSPAFSQGAFLQDAVTVKVEDEVRCPRYTACLIAGVKVGPSPEWLAERLMAIGQRPINNVVDVTNYILFLYGQPLHAFDFDKVADSDGAAHIVVRAAEDGEKLTTLDGNVRELISDMTVISTPEAGAIALAGVMGGQSTEVTEDTVNILLEAATFEAGRTSRTSRNLNLMSESSMRYERGVDDHGIAERAAAAAALMIEVAGGELVAAEEGARAAEVGESEGSAALVDVWPKPSKPVHMPFRMERFIKFVGADIPRSFAVDALRRLGCVVEESPSADELDARPSSGERDANPSSGNLEVIAPTFRPDLEREIDLYEEVLRLWGMDKVAPTLPASPNRVGHITHDDAVRAKLNDTLRASGLNETMTYSFAEPADISRLRMNAEALGLGEPVQLLNPLNSEQSVMRQSIIPGLLRSLSYNQSRGVGNVQLYEIGTVFSAAEGKSQPKEGVKVAGVLAGAMGNTSWNANFPKFDFFDGKGVLENIARELALPKVRFTALSAEEAPHLQPGRAAQMSASGNPIGWVGELHPLAAAEFEVEGPVVAFELDMKALQNFEQDARPYVDIPQFPAVEVDQNFVVDEGVTNERLSQVMSSAGGKLLESVRLFDVYRDAERLGAGKKSMAYTLVYRAPDRTLKSEEVNKAHERLVKKVIGATGAEVRG